MLRPPAGFEPWQLWTGHLVHWSGDHLLWDGLTFAALAWLLGRLAPRALAFLLAFGAPLISVAVLALEPAIDVYGGLSGIDVALWVAVSLVVWRRSDQPAHRVAAGCALLGVTAKVSFEVARGAAFLVGEGVPLAISAHVGGVVIGGVVVLVSELLHFAAASKRIGHTTKQAAVPIRPRHLLVKHLHLHM